MTDWLLVVDMQPVFGAPASPWCTPGFDLCAARIADMVEVYDNRVLFTRFIPPPEPSGAWRSYYDLWSFALEPGTARLWDLDPRWRGRPAVDSARFAKWREAAGLIPPDATIVLCGVATDCCVLGTAVEAVDDGRHVRLVADACAAATPALHEAALAVMRERTPMLEVTDLQSELARAR